jgi:hypothetical protein
MSLVKKIHFTFNWMIKIFKFGILIYSDKENYHFLIHVNEAVPTNKSPHNVCDNYCHPKQTKKSTNKEDEGTNNG